MKLTIKDIAKETGFSISTVSRALNGHLDVSKETKETILECTKANDFKLNNNARNLKKRKSTKIVLVVKGTRNTLFANLVEKIQELVEKTKYTVSVYYIDENADEVEYAKQICIDRNPVGICFLGGYTHNFEKGFSSIDVPSVLITVDARIFNFENLSSVATDDIQGARFATDYLLKAGHRKIGIIGALQSKSAPGSIRYESFRECLRKYDVEFSEEIQFSPARYSYESGYEAMINLINKMPDITAVFCVADVMAIGAMRALADKGKKIPEDISVIGYDGMPMSNFSTPRLATIKQDVESLANYSIDILKSAIRKKSKHKHILLPFEFFEGESVSIVNSL